MPEPYIAYTSYFPELPSVTSLYSRPFGVWVFLDQRRFGSRCASVGTVPKLPTLKVGSRGP